MSNMIFTSHQRFIKKRAPNTQTIVFNNEDTQRPLLNQPNKSKPESYLRHQDIVMNNTSSLRPEPKRLSLIPPTELAPVTDYITPPPPQTRKLLSGPMVRTLPGTAKRSCCGGAV